MTTEGPRLIQQWCTGCGAQMHEGEPNHKATDPGHSRDPRTGRKVGALNHPPISEESLRVMQDFADRRAALADRWTRHYPHSRFEVGGAAVVDSNRDFFSVIPTRDQMDVRLLLNVVATLMDEVDAAQQVVDAYHYEIEEEGLDEPHQTLDAIIHLRHVLQGSAPANDQMSPEEIAHQIMVREGSADG